MPAAVPYLATAGMFLTSAAIHNVWAQLFIYSALIYTSNEITKDLAPKEDFNPPTGIELQHNFCQSGVSAPLVYGEVRMAGDDVFIGTAGSANEYLWIVEAYGEGEFNGIKQSDDSEANDLVFINDKLLAGSEYEDNVSYWFYSGTDMQTYNTDLKAAFEPFAYNPLIWSFPDLPLPDEYVEKDDNYRNTCYMVWRIKYDQKLFPSIPKRNVVLEGRKIWLPDGTKAYSNNAAAVLYDFLKSRHCAFGLGPSNEQLRVDEIDYQSYLAAYNYCEQSSKDWQFNGIIVRNEDVRAVIDRILKHFRGSLAWSEGKIYMKYSDMAEETVEMALTDDHIARDSRGKAMIGMSQAGKVISFDGLKIKFINPIDNHYLEDHIFVGETEGVIKEIDLGGYLSRQTAGAMGAYMYDRSIDPYDRIITGTFRDDVQQLRKGSLITLTCTALGYTSQYMRVRSSRRLASGLVQLDLQLEHLNLYNDTFDDVGDEGYFDYNLPLSSEFNPASAPEVIIELGDADFNSVFEYDLALKNLNKTIVVTSENDVTINLPSVDADHIGAWVKFVHYGSGKLTVQAADSDTIDKSSAGGNVYHQEWA